MQKGRLFCETQSSWVVRRAGAARKKKVDGLTKLKLGGPSRRKQKVDAHLKLKMASAVTLPPKRSTDDTPQKLKVPGGSGPPKRSTLPDEPPSRRSQARVRM